MPQPVQWLAVSLLDGHIICDLPSITSEDPFRRTIGQYETSNAVLTIPSDGSIDPAWVDGILEGAAALIAYQGDPGQEYVTWGGVVTGSNRGLGNQVQIRMVTGEGLLDRRYTGDYTTDPTGVGATKPQNQIAADVVTQFVADPGGVPFTVVQLPDPPGVTGNPQRLATYWDYQDTKVYATLQALSGLDGGPEWTVQWVWDHATNRITPYLYVGTRVGKPATAGLGPEVTFDETECLTGTALDSDYSNGKGATILTAVAPGSGGLGRVQATATAPANGRPKSEHRWTPSTASYDQDSMQGYADRAAAAIGNGTQSLSLVVPYDIDKKRYGLNWGLGDDIGYSLQGGGIPDRIEGVVRCIGADQTDTTVTPVLAQFGGLA